MFTRFGFPGDEAEVRAMTVIYTQIGYFSMQITESLAARLARMPEYVEVFTARRPTPSEIRRFRARHDRGNMNADGPDVEIRDMN